MKPIERKERKERKERQEKIRHARVESQTKTNSSVSQCRSGFYAKALGGVSSELIKYFPYELTNLICGYYLNLNHCHVKELQQLATLEDQNNPVVIDAQVRLLLLNIENIGLWLESGPEEVTEWLKLAKRGKGAPAGQCALGIYYWKTVNDDRSCIAAFRCFKKAADQGYAPAQTIVGSGVWYVDESYTKEQVRDKNVESYRWYCLAADQGYMRALYRLGDCYFFWNGCCRSK